MCFFPEGHAKLLLQVIEWLTGFDAAKQQELMEQKVTFETFFEQATLHLNAGLITGSICSCRIEILKIR